MHDINGKILHVGDEVTSYFYGLCKIVDVVSEDTPERHGACVRMVNAKGESIDARTHTAQMVKVRTWKDMATEALAVQDACNLSGVVTSFSNIIREVRARLESEKKGDTDTINNHAVCRLFSDKIASLTGTQFCNDDAHQNFSDAYKWAHDLKEGK